jgi:hypothetical protein
METLRARRKEQRAKSKEQESNLSDREKRFALCP